MKLLITAVALAAAISAAFAATQIASADVKVECLPPAVVQALSLPEGDDA